VNSRCIFNDSGDALRTFGTLIGIVFCLVFWRHDAYDVIFCPNNVSRE
jgi:hypothetical protein